MKALAEQIEELDGVEIYGRVAIVNARTICPAALSVPAATNTTHAAPSHRRAAGQWAAPETSDAASTS